MTTNNSLTVVPSQQGVESESSDTLEISIGSTSASIDDAILQLEQSSNSSIKTLVVTFGGTAAGRNRFGRTAQQQQQQPPPPPPPAVLSNTDLMRLFQAMAKACSCSGACGQGSSVIKQLRLEWNIIAASFDEQPPLIPLAALGQLLMSATQLTSLELYRLKLVGDNTQYPHLTQCALQNKALQTVRVEFCAPVAIPNLDALVLSLSKLPQVQDLEVIGFQGDSSRGCTSASLQSLCSSDTPSLRTLKIWGGILQTQDPQAVVKLSRALQTNHTIQDLELGLFDLNVESAMALGDALGDNTTLERIWLDVDSSLTEDTMTPLANAMKTNTRIKSFNIVSTKDPSISDNVLQMLVEMTRVNTHLMHLTVRGCNESVQDTITSTQNQYRNALNFYLKLNRVGRQELLQAGSNHNNNNNNHSRRIMAHHKWMSVLACENTNVSVTFFLLQHNPQFITQFVARPPTPSSSGNKNKRPLLHLRSLTGSLQPFQQQQPRPKRRKVIALLSEE